MKTKKIIMIFITIVIILLIFITYLVITKNKKEVNNSSAEEKVEYTKESLIIYEEQTSEVNDFVGEKKADLDVIENEKCMKLLNEEEKNKLKEFDKSSSKQGLTKEELINIALERNKLLSIYKYKYLNKDSEILEKRLKINELEKKYLEYTYAIKKIVLENNTDNTLRQKSEDLKAEILKFSL